jgi:hypothetical protein
MPILISRQAARALGVTRYFTGKPCKYGHVAERLVANCGCITCLAAADRRYHERHPGKRKQSYDAWNAGQPIESKRARNRAGAATQRLRNPDKVRARIDNWTRRNPEKRKQAMLDWWLANPHKRALYNAMRRAAARRPLWADKDAIEAFYRDCPDGLTVDHIVPLGTAQRPARTVEGYLVNGLHVPWNLGYLTLSDNSRKGNRMRPEDNPTAG